MIERGDIYLVSIDPSLGHEQRGYRPVVVVSSHSFNVAFGAPLVVPVTTGGRYARVRGFAVSLEGAELQTRGVARCDQPRILDLEARRARPTGERVPDEIMGEILARLRTILA